MVITFCGHSNYTATLEDEKHLLTLLEIVAQDKQVDFYLGGYGKFDSFAFQCARKYKLQHKNASLIFITTYLEKWLSERKSILKKNYDQIIYPDIEHVPQKFAIMTRNKWMIDQADYIFA